MPIILAAAISIDGKIKFGEKVHRRGWISKEDKQDFADLIDQSETVIAGRKTYRNMRPNLQKGKLYTVMTTRPDKYRSEIKEGFIEFTSEQPEKIIQKIKQKGMTSILIIGGAQVYSTFLKADLVDEIRITIEPVILGSGVDFMQGEELLKRFVLRDVRRLNEAGTLSLTYRPN